MYLCCQICLAFDMRALSDRKTGDYRTLINKRATYPSTMTPTSNDIVTNNGLLCTWRVHVTTCTILLLKGLT